MYACSQIQFHWNSHGLLWKYHKQSLLTQKGLEEVWGRMFVCVCVQIGKADKALKDRNEVHAHNFTFKHAVREFYIFW